MTPDYIRSLIYAIGRFPTQVRDTIIVLGIMLIIMIWYIRWSYKHPAEEVRK